MLSWHNPSNANKNQRTNFKIFIKEKCYKNDDLKKKEFKKNKNYRKLFSTYSNAPINTSKLF